MHDFGQTQQIHERKGTGIDVDEIDGRHPSVDVVCDPVLARQEGRVGWMWIPPTHQGHDFQSCFFRGECKKHRSVEEVGHKRRTMVGTLDIDQSFSQITQVEQVTNEDLSTRFAQRLRASVISPHEGTDRKALPQKLQYGGRSVSASRRRDENSWFVHYGCSPLNPCESLDQGRARHPQEASGSLARYTVAIPPSPSSRSMA